MAQNQAGLLSWEASLTYSWRIPTRSVIAVRVHHRLRSLQHEVEALGKFRALLGGGAQEIREIDVIPHGAKEQKSPFFVRP